MSLGSEMYYGIRLVAIKDLLKGTSVANVHLLEIVFGRA
jgi:hypothetical protein